MKRFSKTGLVLGLSLLGYATPALSADNTDLRRLTESLAVCQGKLAAGKPYQSYIDGLDVLTKTTESAIAFMQMVSRYDQSAIDQISRKSSDEFGSALVSQPLDAKSIVRLAAAECQALIADAEVEAKKVKRQVIEAAEVERRKKQQAEAKAVPEQGKAAVEQPKVEPVAADKSDVQAAETSAAGVSDKAESKPDKAGELALDINEEISNWKAGDQKQKAEAERLKLQREQEKKKREEQQFAEGKPQRDAKRKEIEAKQAFNDRLRAAEEKRGGDVLYAIHNDIVLPSYFEVFDGCKLTPDLALTMLASLRSDEAGFPKNAKLEIAKAADGIRSPEVVNFMSGYVLGTLANGGSNRDKLAAAIGGNTFSALCATHIMTKVRVKELNGRMKSVRTKSGESIPDLVVDYSEPYYGPVCAELSLLMRSFYLGEKMYEPYIERRMRTLEKVDGKLYDFLGYTKNAIDKNDPKIARMINSNQWNQYCVLAATKA